jgi:hypothetical protein
MPCVSQSQSLQVKLFSIELIGSVALHGQVQGFSQGQGSISVSPIAVMNDFGTQNIVGGSFRICSIDRMLHALTENQFASVIKDLVDFFI